MGIKTLTQSIGLSEKEAAVYLAILQLGNSTIQPISKKSGIKRTSIYYFINHLVELKLIDKIAIKGKSYYKALNPTHLVSLQQQRLEDIKESLPEFMNIYQSIKNKPKVSYFEGVSEMKNILLEEVHCYKEALYIWPGKDVIDTVGGAHFMERLDIMRKQNGIHLKVLTFRGREAPFKGYTTKSEDMREIRYGQTGLDFPLAIGLYDTGKVGFLSTKNENFGLLIESKELYHAMTILFQLFWKDSLPST